jgi:nucleoside-diphosphate-sugar epimerase
MKVFLTGGTGFIGGTVARQLRERGDEVLCLVRSPEKAAALTALGCETVAGDLSDRKAIAAAMAGCDAAIHAAAMYEIGIPDSQRAAMREANVIGTENVLGAAADAGIARVVYVSTVGVFGDTHGRTVDESYENPETGFTSYYEETKLEAHKIAKRMAGEGLPVVIVQPGGVYGPGDTSQVADLLEEFFAGKLLMLPLADLGICMAHVDDIAGGIVLALDRGRAGEAYVLSGPQTTMRGAIETVARISGRKAPKRDLPTPLLRALTPIGPLVGKLLGQPPNLREIIASGDGVTFYAGYDKAAGELGYAPRGMEQGLRETLEADDRFPAPAA